MNYLKLIYLRTFLIFALSYLAVFETNAQELADFIQYPCLGQVRAPAKIRSITESEGQVTIYLQTFDNCDKEFAAGIELRGDTLDLKYWEELIDGVTICDCSYLFDFVIQDISIDSIKAFLVNGKTFQEINELYMYMYEGIEVEIEENDSMYLEKILNDIDQILVDDALDSLGNDKY